jgi:hypothetical protein
MIQLVGKLGKPLRAKSQTPYCEHSVPHSGVHALQQQQHRMYAEGACDRYKVQSTHILHGNA